MNKTITFRFTDYCDLFLVEQIDNNAYHLDLVQQFGWHPRVHPNAQLLPNRNFLALLSGFCLGIFPALMIVYYDHCCMFNLQ